MLRRGPFGRSTLLRHTVVALLGLAASYAVIMGLSDYRATQIGHIAVYVCAVAGVTLLVGFSGQISLGNGAFMAVGAYTTALLLQAWHASYPNLALVGILAASVGTSALSGAVVGAAAARLRGPYLAGATLALALGLPTLATWSRLRPHLGGANGLAFLAPDSPGAGFSFFKWQAFQCVVGAVLVLWLVANVSSGRIGRQFRAVRDDEVAASLAGLSVARTQVLAFVISAGCAGLAGGLLAVISQTTGPSAFSVNLSLYLLAAAVFGGLGSLPGVVYGSVLVALLPQWSTDLTQALSVTSEKITANLPLAVYGMVLAVAMIAVPDGVQGGLRRLVRLLTARCSAHRRW